MGAEAALAAVARLEVAALAAVANLPAHPTTANLPTFLPPAPHWLCCVSNHA